MAKVTQWAYLELLNVSSKYSLVIGLLVKWNYPMWQATLGNKRQNHGVCNTFLISGIFVNNVTVIVTIFVYLRMHEKKVL